MRNTPRPLVRGERAVQPFDLFPDAPRTPARADGVEKCDLVDLELVEIRRSKDGVLLARSALDAAGARWAPLSQVEIEGAVVTMPRWLAVDRGWV